MKKIGLGLGILIVILIGTVLAVPSFLNWNEYKEQIEQTASDYTGRTVKIKGDISLSLLPTSALSVKDVTVTNMDMGRAEFMVSLKSLDIKVSLPSVLSSLFGGKVKVEKFILMDPIVALEILPDGRVNWDMGKGDETKISQQNSSADISLDQFQITNGQISFEDMTSGQMELFRKINVNVIAKSINGPFEIEGSAKYKELDANIVFALGKDRPGKKVPLSLGLSMLNERVTANLIGGIILSGSDSSFDGKLDVKATDVGDIITVMDQLQKASPSSTAFAQPKFDQDFALETIIEASHDKLAVSEFNIRMGQSRGQGNGEITLNETINFMTSLTINKLDLDPILGPLSAAGYDKTTLNSKEDSEEGGSKLQNDLLKNFSGTLDLKLGALKYNDKIASQISTNITVKNSVVDISSLQARMPGGASLMFKGQIAQEASPENNLISPILTGDISLNASNIRGMLDWLKMDVSDVPEGQLGQFSYHSAIRATPDLLQIYGMEGEVDSVKFKGGVSYAFQTRPSYGINLDIQNLNFDSYQMADKDNPKSLGEILALLDQFDADYKLRLSNVTANSFKIQAGKLEGLLLGGVLNAKIIKLDDMAGVNIVASGQGSNFASKPEFSLNLDANADSLSTLQRVAKIDDKYNLRKLGKIKLSGKISTTLEKMDVDIKSRIGLTNLDVTGSMRSATLKKFPEVGSIDMQVDANSTSLAALIDQLDLPMVKPMAQDDRPINLKGRLKASSDLVDLDGNLSIAAGEIAINGRRKGEGKAATLDVVLDMKGNESREFIRGLGFDFNPSAKKLGAIALKVKMIGNGDHYEFNSIAGDLGPVKLKGSGKLDMAPRVPIFDFNLKAGDIPLHDFMAADTQKKTNTTIKDKKFGQWTKTQMDMSSLSSFEGHATVSAASLRYNAYIFQKPTFETILKDGVLSVNNFTGRLFGGDVEMSGIIGGTGTPKMEMAINLKKASLIEATKSSAGIAPIEGFFDLSGKFNGEGISQYDMISALSGGGNIVVSPGSVKGIDIPALSGQLAKMSDNGAFLKLLGTSLSGGKTSYKGGFSNITVKDGNIQFSPFDLALDGAKSNVKMNVDLLNWAIKSNGILSLMDHPDAPSIGVDIVGDVSNPKITYNTDRLKKYVGAKIASNMLQKIIGNEGGLENIFGDKPKENLPQQNNILTAPKGGNSPPQTANPPPEDPNKTEQDSTKTPEDFGKRLLQKMFEKTKPVPEKEQ
ncbi:MAG: AsmA family protein [Emcibacter sp.]|nr:AsmA family protein [Emcibacter sp.]